MSRTELRETLRMLLQKHQREILARVELGEIARLGGAVPMERFVEIGRHVHVAALLTDAALEDVIDVLHRGMT